MSPGSLSIYELLALSWDELPERVYRAGLPNGLSGCNLLAVRGLDHGVYMVHFLERGKDRLGFAWGANIINID